MKEQQAFHEGHEPKKRDYGEAENTQKPKKSYQAFMVVLILTGPQNFEERDTIRETWLQGKPEHVLVFFVIGLNGLPIEEQKTLEFENSRHHDLLLLPDLRDSYYALTDKVLEAFAWIESNVDYSYVFKVDDDTYSRLDMITADLQSDKVPQERLYWGFFDGRAHVKRRGQWAEKNWILCDRYTPHALGGGYVLSQDLVAYIVRNTPFLQKFNSEDISVGTWLGPLDIHRIHDPRFDTEWESRGCSNKYIVTHKQEMKDIKEKHRNLKETGKLCTVEKKAKLSFEYNWKVPPTSCCIRNDSRIP